MCCYPWNVVGAARRSFVLLELVKASSKMFQHHETQIPCSAKISPRTAPALAYYYMHASFQSPLHSTYPAPLLLVPAPPQATSCTTTCLHYTYAPLFNPTCHTCLSATAQRHTTSAMANPRETYPATEPTQQRHWLLNKAAGVPSLTPMEVSAVGPIPCN